MIVGEQGIYLDQDPKEGGEGEGLHILLPLHPLLLMIATLDRQILPLQGQGAIEEEGEEAKIFKNLSLQDYSITSIYNSKN